MSASGEQRTLGHVRFTPKSGHWLSVSRLSAFCQKQTGAPGALAALKTGKEPASGNFFTEEIFGTTF